MKPQSHTKNILSAITLTLSILASSSIVFCAEWEVEWQKVYETDLLERAYSVIQNKEGGYTIAGLKGTGIGESGDAFVMNLDSLGNILWEKTYPAKVEKSWFNSIQETADGGYILGGSDGYIGNDESAPWYNAFFVKTNHAGEKEWETISVAGAHANACYEIQQTRDGGYIAIGGMNLIKLNNQGELEWSKPYSGSSIKVTSSNDLVFVDNRYDDSNSAWEDFGRLVRMDIFGNIIFEKVIYDDTSLSRYNSLGLSLDGGYILCGYKSLLTKYDPEGNLLWGITFEMNGTVSWHSVHQTTEGGYIVAGDHDLFPGGGFDSDPIVVYYDGGGNILSDIVFDISRDTSTQSIQQTKDGGYIVVGYTDFHHPFEGDIFITKLAPAPRPKLQNDLNGDGRSDLVLKEKSSGRASLLMMEDDGSTWTVSYSSTWGDKYDLLGTGDLNGDGRDDLILKYKPSETVYLCEMSADASSWNVSYYSQGFYAKYDLLGIGDLNGDGRDDLILKYKPSNTVYICLLNAPGAEKIWTVSYYSKGWAENYSVLGVADLNDDARDDLILQFNKTGTVYFCHMREDGASWDIAATESWSDGQTLLALADLNADFREDLIVGDTHGHATAWIANPDAATWTKTPLGDWSAYDILFTGDLNADHRDDLIRQTRATKQVDFLLTTFDDPTSWTASYTADWSNIELLSK